MHPRQRFIKGTPGKKFSGSNFTLELSNGIKFDVDKVTGGISSGRKPLQGGGWVDGEPEPPKCEMEIPLESAVSINEEAPDTGWEDLEEFDITFAGQVDDVQAKVTCFGCKMQTPENLLDLISKGGEGITIKVPVMITDRDKSYIHLNDKPIVKIPRIEP